jgi:hypothetical protein
MIIITTGLFIFFMTMSFILGLIIMALSYELHLYCKKRKKIVPILSSSVNIINPIHDNNIKKYKDNILFNII